MALGEQLRKARLQRNETLVQVAAATQTVVQTIEDIEREDFSRIPAAVYARGFIKLYARHVGLDPQPLVSEYMAKFAYTRQPSLLRSQIEQRQSGIESPPAEAPVTARAEPEPRPTFSRVAGFRQEERHDQARPEPPSASRDPAMEEPGLGASLGDLFNSMVLAWRKVVSPGARIRRDLHSDLHKHRLAWLRNRPTGSLVKYVPVALGIILILVFVISSLSRLTRKAGPEPVVPLNETKEELRLVIDPPAPYFD